MTETTPNTADLAASTRQPGLRIPFGRRSFILAAMVVIAAGLWLNWGWLTAIGVAPLILSLAPCAVMCGLGICCMKGGSKSCCSKSDPAGEPDFVRTEPETEQGIR